MPKPPATIKSANSGIMDKTPSTFPRFEEDVLSVTQALNAASFAVEPKVVIKQSIATTIAQVVEIIFAVSEMLKILDVFSFVINANETMISPQII